MEFTLNRMDSIQMVYDLLFHSVGLNLRCSKSRYHKLRLMLKLSCEEDTGEKVERRSYLLVVEHFNLQPWTQNGLAVLSSTLVVQKLPKLTLNISSQHISPVCYIIIIFIFNELLK
jgi:hypothetical protein